MTKPKNDDGDDKTLTGADEAEILRNMEQIYVDKLAEVQERFRDDPAQWHLNADRLVSEAFRTLNWVSLAKKYDEAASVGGWLYE